ncbi:MAG: radical SAM family heme chaperone HemW [Duodenibacillus sp.]|nr:radical SAM family heme chaperone HemW [Duodenibacillus sp.]
MLEILSQSAALYIHWPWCVRKCPYCDFNSYACRGSVPETEYIKALLKDLAASAGSIAGRKVSSVFIGGGTPSLMTGGGLGRLLDGVRALVTLTDEAEITMEANPGASEAERFSEYAAVGVTRLSLGVQSFNDGLLKRLGRIHTAEQARRAVAAAVEIFPEVNIDLMYALPGQDAGMLQEDLGKALASGTTHLSFYELTLEEGSAFYKKPPEDLPDPDLAADLGDLVHERLAEGGFVRYEISGYARPGHMCRHNRTYWTFGDYLGVGAGAHGKVTAGDGTIRRTARPKAPVRYLESIREGRLERFERTVPEADLPFEFMLNALRLLGGVPARRFSETTGLAVESLEPLLSELREEGLMVGDRERLAVTELGRRFLSDVQERFLVVRE